MSRLQGKEFFVNPDMIEFIEETPDLVVTLISGKKIVVSGSADELVSKIIEYRIKTRTPLPDIISHEYPEDESEGRFSDYTSRLNRH
ncbi:MAG: flagellar FlbD family protein [Oscillospiraceae bacterium]|nr:flagellar FlbD family protein [Oscillospiraceae bacterium]